MSNQRRTDSASTMPVTSNGAEPTTTDGFLVAIPSTGPVGSSLELPVQHTAEHDYTSSASSIRSSHHTHGHPEPLSLVERFGRRHGQDWPAQGPGNRCASCPGSRRPSRSKTRGDQRTSNLVVYKGIPSRPVMGSQVFQAARKSEAEIKAIKGERLREYYRSL
ncbi:hypothetical protein BGZ65_011013, partial [Modicella reniformis]